MCEFETAAAGTEEETAASLADEYKRCKFGLLPATVEEGVMGATDDGEVGVIGGRTFDEGDEGESEDTADDDGRAGDERVREDATAVDEAVVVTVAGEKVNTDEEEDFAGSARAGPVTYSGEEISTESSESEV